MCDYANYGSNSACTKFHQFLSTYQIFSSRQFHKDGHKQFLYLKNYILPFKNKNHKFAIMKKVKQGVMKINLNEFKAKI